MPPPDAILMKCSLGGARSIIRITNPNAAKERRLIVFRDSFGSSIAPLLAAGYSEITLVDIRYISPSSLGKLIDFTKADDALFLYSASVINNSETIKSKHRVLGHIANAGGEPGISDALPPVFVTFSGAAARRIRNPFLPGKEYCFFIENLS